MQKHSAADMDGGPFLVQCRDCRYGRNFGADRGAAARAGTRHANSKPTHRIRLLRVMFEWSAVESMHQLEEPPPF